MEKPYLMVQPATAKLPVAVGPFASIGDMVAYLQRVRILPHHSEEWGTKFCREQRVNVVPRGVTVLDPTFLTATLIR